jgi:hypothetical protein
VYCQQKHGFFLDLWTSKRREVGRYCRPPSPALSASAPEEAETEHITTESLSATHNFTRRISRSRVVHASQTTAIYRGVGNATSIPRPIQALFTTSTLYHTRVSTQTGRVTIFPDEAQIDTAVEQPAQPLHIRQKLQSLSLSHEPDIETGKARALQLASRSCTYTP